MTKKNFIRLSIWAVVAIIFWKTHTLEKIIPNLREKNQIKLNGAEVKRNILPQQTTEATSKNLGLKTITYYLYNGKANRINARRDIRQFHQQPKLFGIKEPFKPLLGITAVGPGAIIIKGDGPTGNITIPLNNTFENIEIFPEFNLDQLLREYPTVETLEIWFQPTYGGKIKQHETKLEWSGPTEIFLASTSLCDLAALIKPNKSTNFNKPNKSAISIKPILENLATEISEKNLKHDTTTNGSGWQTIRNLPEMTAYGKANCLDLALLTAQRAIDNNLSPYLIVSTGHALCAVTHKNQPVNTGMYFEATEYLSQPDNKKDLPKPDGVPDNNQNKSDNPDNPKTKPTTEATESNKPIKPEPPKNEDTQFYQIQIENWVHLFRR